MGRSRYKWRRDLLPVPPTAKIFRQIIFRKGLPTFTFLGLYNSYFGAVCAFEAQKTLTTEKIDIWIWEKLEINHKTFK